MVLFGDKLDNMIENVIHTHVIHTQCNISLCYILHKSDQLWLLWIFICDKDQFLFSGPVLLCIISCCHAG